MNLYEIENAILDCIDEETGEVIDFEKLDALELERDRIIENLALLVKNSEAAAKAYKEEKDSFAQKQKHEENKVASIKKYLTGYLAGTAYRSTKVNVTFRASKAVEVFSMDALMGYDDCDSYLKYTAPTPDKVAIKNAFANGIDIPGCRIVENSNIQIK